MRHSIIINQQEVQFNTSSHQIFCTSLDVARVFGKSKERKLAKKEQVVTGEAVHSLHTSRPAELGGNNQKLSGSKEHSATTTETIPQSTKDFKAKLKEFNTKNKNLGDLREIGELKHKSNFVESYEHPKIDGFKGVTK